MRYTAAWIVPEGSLSGIAHLRLSDKHTACFLWSSTKPIDDRGWVAAEPGARLCKKCIEGARVGQVEREIAAGDVLMIAAFPKLAARMAAREADLARTMKRAHDLGADSYSI